MRNAWLRTLIGGLVSVLAQILLFRHLTFYGAQVDAVLIFVLWTCLSKNRTQMLFIAAGFGLLQDALLDVWGLNMFSKTLTTFIIYNFAKRSTDYQLVIWQIFLAILGVTFLHNVIFLSLSSFVQIYSIELFPVSFLLGSSIYTALIGMALFALKRN